MKIQTHPFRFLLILTIALAAGLLSACGPSDSTPTPTEVSIEAVYTSAAETLVAQFSQTAAANPTATITPTASITPTATITPTKGPTQYLGPVIVFATATSGTLGPTPTGTLGAVGCYNSAFLSDVTIPDGTTIAAGKTFTKTWSIQNTGTCPWTFDYKFTFIGGHVMGSDTFKIRRTVGPNASTQISVALTAPNAPGTYTGTWRMVTDTGVHFGTSFTVSIKVAGATFTPSPIVSATKTPAPSETPVTPSYP